MPRNEKQYALILKINGDNWMLLLDNGLNISPRYHVLTFETVEAAKKIFDPFRNTIFHRSQEDMEGQGALLQLMILYPVVVEYSKMEKKIRKYIDIPEPYVAGFDIISKPHALLKMKDSCDQFIVLDIVKDMSSGMHLINDELCYRSWTRTLNFNSQ